MPTEILPDFKPGPLDYYRKKASFDWKKLKIFLVTKEYINIENEIIQELQQYPEFHNDNQPKSLDDLRRISLRQSIILKNTKSIGNSNLHKSMKCGILIILNIAPGATIKFVVMSNIFINTVWSLGTERHSRYIEDAQSGKFVGCFCLTEIGHGSNTKGMRTTATFDENSGEFVLNSPDFEAAKCWAASLGQCASFAVVFAQLIVKREKKGLHCFVVPIRDPKTLIPYPGVIIGDMGEKIGLNGIDNGFVMFKEYRIPRENLLNRTGDVSANGEYITPFKDPSKRHGASLGGLSGGRLGITNMAYAYGLKALTIGIRYAAVRKQFGPDDQEEVPVLEYQIHQHRLLPHLAAVYVIGIFCDYVENVFFEFLMDTMTNPKDDNLADRGVEIHAISSGCKPMASWAARDAIQECREACGGHGYLKAAGIGDLRNNNDANCTYEGENHVLIQQTSNWLLKLWALVLKGAKVTTPLKTADFLTDADEILKTTLQISTIEELCSPEIIMLTYKWLVCYLLKEFYTKLQQNNKEGVNIFWAKMNNQVYLAKNMSVAFIQHVFLERMLILIDQSPDENIRHVLLRLFSLYAISSLEKHHLGTLYKGGFLTGSLPAKLLQESVIKLCADLKNDAVSLIDAVAFPDFAMNSVLGASDGQVYKRLESEFLHSSYGMSRPSWWQDITEWESYALKSKL